MTDAAAAWRACRERHLHRDFGGTGRRLIRLAVLNAGREAIVYTIDHLWRRSERECSSILYIRRPAGLRGTFVRIAESGVSEAARIELKLVTAARAIAIEGERQRQQVLGTDFSYEDLRFWRPLPETCLSAADGVDGSTRLDYARMLAKGPLHESMVVRSDGEILQYRAETPAGSRTWWVDEWASVVPPSPHSIGLSRLDGRFESRMALLALDRDTQWDDALFDWRTGPGEISQLFEDIGEPAGPAP